MADAAAALAALAAGVAVLALAGFLVLGLLYYSRSHYAAIPIGSALGYIVGGLVGEAHGWRAGAGYQPGEPNFAAIQAWNAAGVYQKAIALMGRQIDGGDGAAAR